MNVIDNLSRFFPSFGRSTQIEYYFALRIDYNKVEAAIWGVSGKRLEIINSAQAEYGDEEGLTKAANIALDEALADFAPEPEKILFGVPDSWLQDENLKPEYLKRLKDMVGELGVTPMAYVSTTQAISHLLQKKHGVPLTAVLVQVSDPLIVSVIKAGKVIGTKVQKRSGNLPEDIEKTLLGFGDVEVLPSKILLYGGQMGQFKDELSSFSWMSQLPFLHLPKIDQLDVNTALLSICLAGGAEINSNIVFYEDSISRHGLHQDKKKKELENLGFIPGDVEHTFEEQGMEEPQRSLDRPKEDYSSTQIVHPKKHSLSLPTGLLPGNLFPGKLGRSAPVKIAVLLFVVLALLAAAAIFLPKAIVTVFIDMRSLERESQVIADPSLTQPDEANKKIPGKVAETVVSGSAKGNATGKKKVGEVAKGTVLIYNKTTSPKTFASGTILLGPDDSAFTLDTSVNVASASAVDGGIAFGKATANISASVIGPEGNLPAGKELSIKDQPASSYSAKVDQALSGGVSKDVTVVASDDQKRLLAQLSSDLRRQAKDQLQAKLTGDFKVLEESLSENITNTAYSKGVNDQAQEFTLNLSIRFKGTAYNDNDLKAIVAKLVETNVPAGYELDLSRTETQAQVSKVDKDGKLIFVAKFKAKLMPKLDIEKIKKDIAGKQPEEVAIMLKGIENVIGSDIKITPSLPFKKLQILPLLPQNISVEITAK